MAFLLVGKKVGLWSLFSISFKLTSQDQIFTVQVDTRIIFGSRCQDQEHPLIPLLWNITQKVNGLLLIPTRLLLMRFLLKLQILFLAPLQPIVFTTWQKEGQTLGL